MTTNLFKNNVTYKLFAYRSYIYVVEFWLCILWLLVQYPVGKNMV